MTASPETGWVFGLRTPSWDPRGGPLPSFLGRPGRRLRSLGPVGETRWSGSYRGGQRSWYPFEPLHPTCDLHGQVWEKLHRSMGGWCDTYPFRTKAASFLQSGTYSPVWALKTLPLPGETNNGYVRWQGFVGLDSPVRPTPATIMNESLASPFLTASPETGWVFGLRTPSWDPRGGPLPSFLGRPGRRLRSLGPVGETKWSGSYRGGQRSGYPFEPLHSTCDLHGQVWEKLDRSVRGSFDLPIRDQSGFLPPGRDLPGL